MRKPIELDPNKAAGSVIRQSIQTEAVRVALAAFADGRGLEGDWELEVRTGREFHARLIPVEPLPPPQLD